MINKLGVYGLVYVILISFLCGCQKEPIVDEKYHEIDYTKIDFANEISDFEKREKEIVVLTEENIESEVDTGVIPRKAFLEYLHCIFAVTKISSILHSRAVQRR